MKALGVVFLSIGTTMLTVFGYLMFEGWLMRDEERRQQQFVVHQAENVARIAWSEQ